MNPPWVYTCSPSWTPSHLPPHPIPLGHPSAPAPSSLYYALNLDWRFISHVIIYMFQCHSPISSYPCPPPRVQKSVLYICVTFAVLHTGLLLPSFGIPYIYVLVYCIGVFLSGYFTLYKLKHLPAMRGTWVQSLGREDPLEKEMIILYARQQKRHRCIQQSFGLCGRGRGWDNMGEWHWNM